MKHINLRDEVRFPMTPALHERFSLKLKLDDNRFIPVKLLDVSLHGMRFCTDYNLKEQSVKEFSFTYKDKDEKVQNVTIFSRICWIEDESDTSSFNVGTQIVEVADQSWMKLILDVIANM